MKKITLLLAGLMVSGMASAVQLTVSGPVTMAACPPINEDVRLNLSSNVQAGVSCSATVVGLSACHTGGKVTQRTVPVVLVAADDTTGVPEHYETCSLTADPAVPGCANTPVTGPAMATATTAMGTVSTQYPGGATCSAAGAEANSTVMIAQ
ncbi:hypothetical protein [Pseudomonas borbori]|uniref:hypothetical protein n=1 Tax=Pseudomonas borbori TaxID=289003 RepID=UPI0011315630|nr:hypothetical protein [Pseudomonas borbori]